MLTSIASILTRGHVMKRVIALILTLLVTLSGTATAWAADTTPTPLPDDFDYFGAVPSELPDDAEKMVVDSVHDGDSIRLTGPNDDWWESYRIIGIQAPEIEGYRKEECYGQESAAFLKSLLPKGTEVYIQQDISDKDSNDRFLRHIFIIDEETGDAYLLSEVLVLGGYAVARSYPPDDLYDDILAEAQEIAEDEDEGLWDACAA
jgi:endonuclease YncB( thermonuclease family)